ncbi:hypothetical protein [Treponema sp. J25]|uniref:hypothetical protein n=1 Tax=Treponema sp. J25 TaxID=2094121 RepID=UPI001042A236|nr:hypothetical protein [Treponema sp. J25]TCW60680.1 hypothetical protein C5O22_10065 [Treponema sp. J25]
MNEQRRPSLLLSLLVYALIILGGNVIVSFFVEQSHIPLPGFAGNWIFCTAIERTIPLIPPVLFCAIITSIGLYSQKAPSTERFSLEFMKFMGNIIVQIIIVVVLYSLLLLLVRPLCVNSLETMKTKKYIYERAKSLLQAEVQRKSWKEAAFHLTLCEEIWKGDPELVGIRDTVATELEKERVQEFSLQKKQPPSGLVITPEGTVPALKGIPANLKASEALQQAKKAKASGRLYDAHWLASLAIRLASPGTLEQTEGQRIASETWEAIQNLTPDKKETERYTLFKQKQEGYMALLAEEYQKAYYVYARLIEQYPKDPDVITYYPLALRGLQKIAFFIDEITTNLGEPYVDVLLPLPDDKTSAGTLTVLAARQISFVSDAVYLLDLSVMTVDKKGAMLQTIQAPYGKIIPQTTGPASRQSATILLLKAIDRKNETIQYLPTINGKKSQDKTFVVFPLSFGDLYYQIRSQKAPQTQSVVDLWNSLRVPQKDINSVFQQQTLLMYIFDPFFCLTLAIFVLVGAWRLRSTGKVGFLSLVFLGLLPVLTIPAYQMGTTVLSDIYLYLLVSVSFLPTLFILLGSYGALLFLGFFALGAQKT